VHLLSDARPLAGERWLSHALDLAMRGLGTVSPNPLVGAVIVKDGEVVGEGWHERAGEAHAEVRALDAAGDRAAGAEVYVTLEPCNHFGRTPPCTNALIKAGVARVVIGMADPNGEVAGGGARRLREAGVEVRFAEDPRPFEDLNEAWIKRVRTGMPWTRVKVALSLDGKASLIAGRRARMTGPGAAAVTRRLRTLSTAVGVGAATLAVDDPGLTVRAGDGTPVERQPLRVVFSRTSVPRAGHAIFTDGLGRACVVASDRSDEGRLEAVRAAGAGVVRYPYEEGIRGALRALAAEGVNDVLVEAGPGMLTALWDAQAIDELIVLQSGGMAGNAAPPLFLGRPADVGGDLDVRLRAAEAVVAGDDAAVVWRPMTDEEA